MPVLQIRRKPDIVAVEPVDSVRRLPTGRDCLRATLSFGFGLWRVFDPVRNLASVEVRPCFALKPIDCAGSPVFTIRPRHSVTLPSVNPPAIPGGSIKLVSSDDTVNGGGELKRGFHLTQKPSKTYRNPVFDPTNQLYGRTNAHTYTHANALIGFTNRQVRGVAADLGEIDPGEID